MVPILDVYDDDDDNAAVYNIVFLIINIRCSKHVADKKN
jgi:hypothetical protein